jgi:hypothetical protein
MSPNNPVYSTMVRAGKSTFFVDVREAKNGKKYLSISENRIDGEERKRSSVRVFSEAVDQFRQAVDEAVGVVVG